MKNSNFTQFSNPNPSNGRNKAMKYFFAPLATIFVALTLATAASAQSQRCINKCNAGDPSNVTTCLAACGNAAPPATATPTTTVTPTATTKACAKEGGKMIPVTEWTAARCNKPGGGGTVKCGENEVAEGKACICAEGFQRLTCDGPCVPKCKDDEGRNNKDECVKLGGGTVECTDPCAAGHDGTRQAFLNAFAGIGYWFWLLIAILVTSLANLGLKIYTTFFRKEKKGEGPKPPTKAVKAGPPPMPAPAPATAPAAPAVTTFEEAPTVARDPEPEPAPRPRRAAPPKE